MGRPRNPGTPNERAKRRREMVRVNVQEYRRRRKEVLAASYPNLNEDASAEQQPEEPLETSDSSDLSQRVRLCLALDGKLIRWLLQPPLRLSLGPAYRDAFIAAWSERCRMPDHHDDSVPDRQIHVNVCCGSWVDSACIIRSAPGNDILSNALLASALVLVGETNHDIDMVRRGVDLESDVFSALRQRMQQQHGGYEAHELPCLTTTVLTVAVASLLVKKSWIAFALHLSGVGALIEYAGPDSLTSQTAVDQFFAFRAVQAPFVLIERKRTFLSDLPWIDFACRDQFRATSPCLQSLLDVIFAIPTLMQEVDEAVTSITLPSTRPELIEKFNTIESNMTEWERRWNMRFPWSSPETSLSPGHMDCDAMESMEFPDTITANVASFFLGGKVALNDLGVQINAASEMEMEGSAQLISEALESKILQTRIWAAGALQCIKTFRVLEPRTIGKLVCLFPLDMAWRAFHNLHRTHGVDCKNEIATCEQLAAEYELTGLPVLRRH